MELCFFVILELKIVSRVVILEKFMLLVFVLGSVSKGPGLYMMNIVVFIMLFLQEPLLIYLVLKLGFNSC